MISGLGELHLEVVVERLRREYGVAARVGTPRVAYRETITRRAEGENKFVRQLGPRGEYGHVKLVVEPVDRGGGFVYENRAATTEIPQEHAAAVEDGVGEAVERGVLSGHPLTDVRVQVVHGGPDGEAVGPVAVRSRTDDLCRGPGAGRVLRDAQVQTILRVHGHVGLVEDVGSGPNRAAAGLDGPGRA